MKKIQKKKKACLSVRRGFTLVELLLVIAIIGILSGIVVVSSQGSVEKSKNASAVTTMSSLLPEFVTCQDDGFSINAYDTTKLICNDTAGTPSHTVKWPNLTAKTGYTITALSATNANIGTYTFTASNGTKTITCKYAENECTSS